MTYIVGPVTGEAIGASDTVITLSVAAGLVKSILVMIGTPLVAKYIGLNNPQSAMVFGGLMGTTSGVAAGLAATDPKLVPLRGNDSYFLYRCRLLTRSIRFIFHRKCNVLKISKFSIR